MESQTAEINQLNFQSDSKLWIDTFVEYEYRHVTALLRQAILKKIISRYYDY